MPGQEFFRNPLPVASSECHFTRKSNVLVLVLAGPGEMHERSTRLVRANHGDCFGFGDHGNELPGRHRAVVLEAVVVMWICPVLGTINSILDSASAVHRQSQRVLRPLLACLATKSAAEAGTPPNLYGGQLCFKRMGSEGPVWIFGDFENKPGSVRIAFQRSSLNMREPGPDSPFECRVAGEVS